MTVAGSQTTATFSSGFDYNRTYSFRVYAVSSSGGWSGASNTVTATLLKDTTPAAKPVVSSTGIGPTHVDLAWSYADNDPSPRFDIYVNGQLWHGQVAGTAKRIVFLSPDTTYTFTVRARDSAGNWSEMSDPFVVTTPAADPNDHEPPTMPPGFWGGIIDGATEAMVFWGNSTDNVTPQEHIRYYLYLNGAVRRRDGRPLPAPVHHVPDARHREHDRGVRRRRGRKPLRPRDDDDRHENSLEWLGEVSFCPAALASSPTARVGACSMSNYALPQHAKRAREASANVHYFLCRTELGNGDVRVEAVDIESVEPALHDEDWQNQPGDSSSTALHSG